MKTVREVFAMLVMLLLALVVGDAAYQTSRLGELTLNVPKQTPASTRVTGSPTCVRQSLTLLVRRGRTLCEARTAPPSATF